MEGFRDWLIAEEKMQIPKDAIKIALPKVRQQTNYSCGPAALKAIAKYFQVGTDDEKDYIKLCKATKELGSSPDNIEKAAIKLGLKTKLKKNMTIKELLNYLKKGIPVICSMQAWGSGGEVYDKAQSGHYNVAIGFDDKKIYFEDPSIDHPDRGYLSYEEFDDRWHDIEVGGKHFSHLGIALWKDTPLPDAKRSRAKKVK
jgi:predicted double-glycine peptidase